MTPDDTIDARNLLCPLPVLKARKKLMQMARGDVLAVIASDPAALVDMPHFCSQSGHTLLMVDDVEEGQCYFIECGGLAE